MKNLILFVACFLVTSGRLSGQTTRAGETFQWKHKTDMTAFSLNGLGFFWNVKKAENPDWDLGFGFRFDIITGSVLLGPSFDIHRIIEKGKISPMYGIQLGAGGVFDTYYQFGDLDGAYFHATPYAGINIKTNSRVELEAGLHLRYTISDVFDGFFATPLFFSMKF